MAPQEEKQMKRARIWITLGLIAATGSATPLHAQTLSNLLFSGASYVTTIIDSKGNFASRGVINLNLATGLSFDRIGAYAMQR
jgi:hypothetical protein